MGTSSNAQIQALMNQIDAADDTSNDLEAQLQKIAELVAAETNKVKQTAGEAIQNMKDVVDPADAFACEGCQ